MNTTEQQAIEQIIEHIRYQFPLNSVVFIAFVLNNLEVLRIDDIGSAVDLVLRIPKVKK